MLPAMQRPATFIVRLWYETGVGLDGPILRGSVQQVGSEQIRYFDALDEVLLLLRDGLESGYIAHVYGADDAFRPDGG